MSDTKKDLNIGFSLIKETLDIPFQTHFPTLTDGLVKGQPGEFVLTPEYAKQAERIYHLPLRADDSWVVTHPKCGSLKFTEN